MNKKYKAKYIILILSSLIFYLSSLLNCTSPTKTETVTFSGTVTLEDTTDYSGVEVMLFKPVEIDTALTNLNKQYPGVGIELNQRTEFYWREHTPVYQTTTDASGKWQIKNVEPGTYHIVAKKDGYGWRVLYDAIDKSENIISLKKAIILNGTIGFELSIDKNRFIKIDGTTNINAKITIEEGTIIELQNNSELIFNNKVEILGNNFNRVYFLPLIQDNNNIVKIINSQGAYLDYCCFKSIKKGIYLREAKKIFIKNTRLSNQEVGIEFFNCYESHFSNCLFDSLRNGIIGQNSKSILEKNIIVNINNVGIDEKSSKGSLVKNNVIKNCEKYGIGLNYYGYGYKDTYMEIIENDFINNSVHIRTGFDVDSCKSNYNNFLDNNKFIVMCDGVFPLVYWDFNMNFWSISNETEIKEKIFDRSDMDNNVIYRGPYIVFESILLSYYKWNNK